MRMGGLGFCMGRFFVPRGMHDEAAKVYEMGYSISEKD
jgi:hypothetical protein